MHKKLMISIAALSVVGCGSNKEGMKPSGELKQRIETAVRAQVRDPDSLKLEWYPISATADRYCLRVNAKNAFGGYVGYLPVMVLFSDATKTKIDLADIPSTEGDTASEADNCIRAGYPVGAPPADS